LSLGLNQLNAAVPYLFVWTGLCTVRTSHTFKKKFKAVFTKQ